MASFKGGTQVKAGYYWQPRSWKVEVVSREGGRLPDSGASYLKLPFPLVLALVPVLGALFLMFMPLIGFVLFAHAVVKKVTGSVKEGAADLAATVSPGWQPGEAHFTGKPGEEGEPAEKDEAAPTETIDALEKEIEAKRKK